MFDLSKRSISKKRSMTHRTTASSQLNQPMQYGMGNTGMQNAMESMLPKQGIELNKLYRKIYQYDSVSGAAVDLMAMLPFSDFSVSGVEDKAVLQVYQDTLEHLNIRTLMPQMAVEFLTIGSLVGTMVYNDTYGIFTDIIVQDPDYLELLPIPLQGYDPKVDLKVPPEFRKFLTSKDARDQQAKRELPQELITKLLSGKVALDPLTTLYCARKTYPKDTGTSYLSRIVPFYMLEQILLEGTIQGAQRRQRAIMHITAGSEDWEPTEGQLEELIEMFISADLDPIGAVVATKRDVDVGEVRSGGDFWKVTDEWDSLTQAKMRSLGINEAFLTGDATYNTMEAALSVFIETLRAFRFFMTQRIFYATMFPLLARVHRFVKRKQSELDHNIRITGRGNIGTKRSGSQDIPLKDLIIPEIQWHKQLQPQYDESYLSILSTVEEAGIPIPLRVWAAAGGFSIEKILDGMEEDKETRRKIGDYKKEIAKYAGEEEEGYGLTDEPTKPNRQKRTRPKAEDRLAIMGRAANNNDPKTAAVIKKLMKFSNDRIPDPNSVGSGIVLGRYS
jgi:hypothetical protein